jgi:hypothetical protein
MHPKTRLVLLFYRQWVAAGLLTTVLCAWTVALIGLVAVLPALLLKAGTTALAIYFMRGYGSRTICYFTNRGISPRRLWGTTVALDSAVFLICVAAAAIFSEMR